MLMEIAQLCKSTYKSYISNMAHAHTLAEPKLKVNPLCTRRSPNECPYQYEPSTSYRIQQPGQVYKTHGRYDKVKSRSHHDVALLQLPNNVPTKYQLATPYGF